MKELGQTNFQIWKKIDEKATAAFDGLRGSAFQWKWVWGMGSGINNDKHLSINFGTIHNIGEDVIHINNKVIPIRGIDYTLD